ncbi:MAG: hypothetical protein Q8P52_01085 [bacterium]|nr:hypothetical protein [bacterium]
MNNERTATFLMANLGSEVSRLFLACEKEDGEKTEGAYNRAQKIIAEIKTMAEVTKERKEELGKLEQVIEDIYKKEGVFNVSYESINKCFLPFALFALKKSGGARD